MPPACHFRRASEDAYATLSENKVARPVLAFICLLTFVGVGVIYFQHWVIRKPFGIILFVGEGLSPARLAPTRTFAAGAGSRLNMDSMPVTPRW